MVDDIQKAEDMAPIDEQGRIDADVLAKLRDVLVVTAILTYGFLQVYDILAPDTRVIPAIIRADRISQKILARTLP